MRARSRRYRPSQQQARELAFHSESARILLARSREQLDTDTSEKDALFCLNTETRKSQFLKIVLLASCLVCDFYSNY